VELENESKTGLKALELNMLPPHNFFISRKPMG